MPVMPSASTPGRPRRVPKGVRTSWTIIISLVGSGSQVDAVLTLITLARRVRMLPDPIAPEGRMVAASTADWMMLAISLTIEPTASGVASAADKAAI